MTHLTSSREYFRPGYRYYKAGPDGFVGVPRGVFPSITWNHIDGPLLHLSDGQMHWLTLWERLRFWLGLEDAHSLDRKHAQAPAMVVGGAS